MRKWLILLVFAAGLAGAAEPVTNSPARLQISGFGLLGNREVARLLRNFYPDAKLPAVVDRTFVEDAALVLLARAQDEGFLQARLHGDFTLTNGDRQRFVWTNALEAVLARDFAATSAHFRLQGGQLFYYQSVDFVGVTAFSKRIARSYFVSGDGLVRGRASRVYSPGALRSSLAALRVAYARAGYESVEVSANQVTENAATGAVKVEIVVEEGLPTIVRSVKVQAEDGTALRTLRPRQPFSRLWQQALTQKLEAQQQVKGFPDASVEFTEARRETDAGSIQLDLIATVTTGPLVRVGTVKLEGQQRTQTAVLKSRVRLVPGKPLNRVAAEQSRQSLARLGVFDTVQLRYEPVDEATRDVIYEVKEGQPLALSLLAGFGSYELLRGGLEVEHRNLFGLAQSVRLRAVQSFKATKGDVLYTVPEVFGENVNLFVQGAGLLREEVSFNREEYNASIGVQKRLAPIQTDLTLRYVYEFLNAVDLGTVSTNQIGVTDARAAAIVLELQRDRRDNPLLPRRGLRLFTKLEVASATLGGNVDYQRVLVGAAYHVDLQEGRLLHFGVTHGMSFTLGGTAEQLPFNKRFFPGGDSSVRGYREGEASPLDDNGKQLGAETFTQANFEFEQLITKTWSVVTFLDAVGFAQDRADYPWDETLFSVGGGLCWRSPIGPVRLTYGHNLNPRRHDPAGALHFSIGAPF